MNTPIREKKYQYSEVFFSFQGEGQYTGVPTAWLRLWGCNLSCLGFGQVNIDEPSTWDLVYTKLDFSKYKTMEELPVLEKCCDSGYSHEKEFAHLAYTDTASIICDKIETSMKSQSNPEGKFLHPKSKQWSHMAFTGGEPMMSQNAIVDIMQEFERRDNVPKYVTVETNGTQRARSKFSDYMNDEFSKFGIEWFWSASPKLYTSGESEADTLKPEVIQQYNELSSNGQLKYVVDGSDRAWDAVEKYTTVYREAGVNWPVWIMPIGASVEGQELIQKNVALGAMARGYNVAARVHCFVFGNAMAT